METDLAPLLLSTFASMSWGAEGTSARDRLGVVRLM